MDKVIYKNTENGVIYQVMRGKVFRWHEEKERWFTTQLYRPCDLAHYPFIGVRVEIYPHEDK